MTTKTKLTSIEKEKLNIFILHSLNGDTLQFWGEDVEEYAKKIGIDCFLPQFPIRENSSYLQFNSILYSYLSKGILNNNSIIIAHSIGNPYFIKFCREHNFVPKIIIAVAPGGVYRFPSKRTDYVKKIKEQAYLRDEDFEYAKNLKNIYLIHSDEDDGNKEKFLRFEKDFNTKTMYLKGYNHFDGYHRIYKIPELIDLLDELIKEM